MNLKSAGCAAVALLCFGGARASADGPVVMLGVGPGASTRFEGSDKYRPTPFIFAQARWGNRYFVGTDGGGIRADIVGWRVLEAGPEVSYRFGRGGRNDTQDPVMENMPVVKDSAEIGGFVAINLPMILTPGKDAITLEASHLVDVSNAHEGTVSRVAAKYRGRLTKKVALQAGPFATYGSEEFMSAYYDVTPAAAAATGLEVFDAEEGWKDYGGRGSLIIQAGGPWMVIVSGTYRHYVNDAADSPVVSVRGSEGVWFGGGALSRRF